MNPAQLVMDVEGFDTYAELLKFLDNGNFTDKAFSEEKIELSNAKPVYLPDGFKLINQSFFSSVSISFGFRPQK